MGNQVPGISHNTPQKKYKQQSLCRQAQGKSPIMSKAWTRVAAQVYQWSYNIVRKSLLSRYGQKNSDFKNNDRHLLSQDFPLGDFRNLGEFPHYRIIAGVLEGWFVVGPYEIEEGAEIGIAGMLGELFVAFGQLGEEGEDFIGG
jgi:hypothetical protein